MQALREPENNPFVFSIVMSPRKLMFWCNVNGKYITSSTCYCGKILKDYSFTQSKYVTFERKKK